jgi:hypothetical protein
LLEFCFLTAYDPYLFVILVVSQFYQELSLSSGHFTSDCVFELTMNEVDYIMYVFLNAHLKDTQKKIAFNFTRRIELLFFHLQSDPFFNVVNVMILGYFNNIRLVTRSSNLDPDFLLSWDRKIAKINMSAAGHDLGVRVTWECHYMKGDVGEVNGVLKQDVNEPLLWGVLVASGRAQIPHFVLLSNLPIVVEFVASDFQIEKVPMQVIISSIGNIETYSLHVN